MKAVTLRQPWASLIAEGAKWIETRDWRCTSLIGTTVGIHAGRHAPAGPDYDPGARPRVGDWAIERLREPTGIEWAMEHTTNIPGVVTRIGLPLGALVATARVTGCIPISGVDGCGRVEHIQPSRHGGADWLLQCWPTTGHYGPPPNSGTFDDWETERIDDQLPFGDFTPGRWGWLLADIVKLDEPIEARGMPGIWTIPDEIEALVA